MGRFVLGAAGALLVGLAVWAAWPSAPPLAGSAGGMPSSELVGPTPIVPKGVANPIASPPAADELDVKIAGCIGATRNAATARAKRGGPAPAGEPSDAAVVSRGCAPLYKEAPCRDAMVKFDEPPPERRSMTVLQTCARAYCDKLGAPKPAVCAHVDAIPEDEQQYTEWNELRQAILSHDIGPSATAIVLAGPARPR